MKSGFAQVQWFCPNCGSLVMGVRNKEGLVKVKCRNCFAVMVSRSIGRRCDQIDIHAPDGQARRGG